jgi:TolB-like protein/Tfp pilus assembly protein PilF
MRTPGSRSVGWRAVCLCVFLCLRDPVALFAQCPDGSPPPCAGAAARVAAPPANSVAVLYFESRQSDTSAVALADGLTEEIINRLSGMERLTVRSRYLVRRYRDAALEDPAAVARSLNVAWLVSGSVRRVGGRLRVNAELLRAAGGVQVWGQQFDQAGEDVFAIQEVVASQVARGIVGRLLPAETRALATRPTASPEAYAAYLRGNIHMARRDSAGMLRAIEEFENALRADPGFTSALSRIATAYGITYSNGFDLGLPRDTVAARAVRSAEAAVRRAPGSSDAWLAMGGARLAQAPQRPGTAREAFERAVALDSANAEAHHLLGFTYAMLGQDDLGLAHDRIALSIEPARPVTVMHFAQYHMRLGQYAEARRWVDSTLVFDRDFWPARCILPWLMLMAGETAAARSEVARWRDLRQARGIALIGERLVASHAGDSAAAAQWRASIRSMIPAELPVSQGLAISVLTMTATHDLETVLAVMEAIRPRGAFLNYYMRYAVFDPLRGDPRFQRLFGVSRRCGGGGGPGGTGARGLASCSPPPCPCASVPPSPCTPSAPTAHRRRARAPAHPRPRPTASRSSTSRAAPATPTTSPSPTGSPRRSSVASPGSNA